MPYDHYKIDKFQELLKHAYRLGRYSGEKVLFNLKVLGAFEGYSGRASETWEQKFIITSDEITVGGGQIIPAINVEGQTIDEVCGKAVNLLPKS